MGFEVVKGILTMKMSFIATTTMAALLWLLGIWARKKFSALEKYCIPAPVIGGFVFALLAWILRSNNILIIQLDNLLQTPFQLIFFTAIGLAASFSLLARGGKLFLLYLIVACWLIAIVQNVLGVGMAYLVGIHPVLGVMAGAVSLEGGPGNAAAFGPMAEKLGVMGATTVGITAATYGILVSGFLGGPVARWLIERYKTPIETTEDKKLEEIQASLDEERQRDSISTSNVVIMITMILVMMVIGDIGASKVKEVTGFDLPSYVGGMFVAIIFRNINDCFHVVKLSPKSVDLVGDVCLGLFLTLAMMSLKIWELANLAVPLIIMLAAQTVFCVLFCIWPLFHLLGKNYDAAVMCAGMIGHNLGVAPNAVANMDAVCRRYGVVVNKAFIIVPLCGAVLVDIIAIPNIVWFINYFAK